MPRVEKAPREPSTTDLFGWLDAVWTKAMPDGTPPTFMMHRFLASERDFADVARWLQLEVRDPLLVFKTWQAFTPKGRGAPRLQYVAAKRLPAEEELVSRMKVTLAESRRTVEEMISVIAAAGQLSALYAEFGVEAPDES